MCGLTAASSPLSSFPYLTLRCFLLQCFPESLHFGSRACSQVAGSAAGAMFASAAPTECSRQALLPRAAPSLHQPPLYLFLSFPALRRPPLTAMVSPRRRASRQSTAAGRPAMAAAMVTHTRTASPPSAGGPAAAAAAAASASSGPRGATAATATAAASSTRRRRSRCARAACCGRSLVLRPAPLPSPPFPTSAWGTCTCCAGARDWQQQALGAGAAGSTCSNSLRNDRCGALLRARPR